MLASASDAIIIGFNVRPDANARREAERTNVEIRTYRVIYDAIEEVRKALEGLLEPDIQEVIVGRAEVRATFSVPGAGTVAGLYVTEGKLTRNVQIRLIRDGVVVHEGPVASLKRFEDDVREVQAGYECGLGIENFTDIKEGDEIEAFTEKEVKRTLD
jgi:translation initiation factor IF-2